MNWLSKNKWRIALALTVGVVAFIITHPALAALPQGASTALDVQVTSSTSCEVRVADIDETKIVSAIRVEGSEAIDLILVLLVEYDGSMHYLTVTSHAGCVVDVQ